MNLSESLGPIAVAFLCILALGLAAATLTTPVDSGEGSGSGASESGDGDGKVDGSIDAEGVSAPNMSAEMMLMGDNPEEGICVDQAEALPFWPFVLGIAGLVAAVVMSRYGRVLGTSAFFLTAFPLLLVMLILTGGCVDSIPDSGMPENLVDKNQTVGSAGQEGGGDQEATEDERTFPVTVPSTLIMVLVLVTAVVLGWWLIWTRDPVEESTEAIVTDEQDTATTVGTVAGNAADELETGDADLENEVYRAWAEMAKALDIDHPDTCTPAEFAEAATEAGIDPDDVRDLTALFEQVRYGTADATADREQQAIDALRRIESDYAEGGEGE